MKHKRTIMITLYVLITVCVIAVGSYRRECIEDEAHKAVFADLEAAIAAPRWESSTCIVIAKKRYQYVIVEDEYGKQHQIVWLDGIDSEDLVVGEPTTVYMYKAKGDVYTPIIKIGHRHI